MTSKIFIGGGGDIEDSFEFDKSFFKLLPNNATILYLPTASATTTLRKEVAYDWFSRLISIHRTDDKIIDFQMWSEVIQPLNMDVYDAVYVGGGNTYHLIEILRVTSMMQILEEYIQNGGIYYGGSAGGIILGKSLLTVEEENTKNLHYHQGVNLIANMSIYPHFVNSETDRVHVQNLCSIYGLRILAIPETGGVIVDGCDVKAFGEVYIFEHEKEISICSSGETIR